MFWGLDSTAWTALYTIITFLMLVVAVWAALYARGQWVLAKGQREDASLAAVEATRPYIVVTVEPSPISMAFSDLVIRNVGQRPAMNVRVALDPPPKRAHEEDSYALAKAKVLTEPIAIVAPGQEIRIFYDSQIERADRDDLPTWHTARLTYSDSSGRRYDNEEYTLDVETLKGALYSEVRGVHHVAESLEEIKKILASAPLLVKRGVPLDVEAVVESRDERARRLSGKGLGEG